MKNRREPRTEREKQARRKVAEESIPADLHAKAAGLAKMLLKPKPDFRDV